MMPADARRLDRTTGSDALPATRALSSDDIGFRLPLPSLLAFTLVAVLAGALAAVLPTRRAARLNVLAAPHYD